MTSSRPRKLAVHELASDNLGFVCFALLWTAVIAWVLARQSVSAFEQWQTTSYAETRGTITHSELRTHSDSDGKSYSVELSYRYSVAGRTLTGHHIKLDGPRSSTHARFAALHSRFKKDAEVPVYFDPRAPERSVLIRGQVEWLFLVFFMPFIGGTITLWALCWDVMRVRCFDSPAGGLPVTRKQDSLSLTISDHRKLIVGALWSSACALLMFVGFGNHDVEHAPAFILTQLVLAPVSYLLVRRFEQRLVLNARARTFELVESGEETVRGAYDSVRALWVRERSYRSYEGTNQFVLTIELEQPHGWQIVSLNGLTDPTPVAELRDWLAQQLAPQSIALAPVRKDLNELDLPRVWRAKRGGIGDWLALLVQSAFALFALLIAFMAMLALALGEWPKLGLWPLVTAAVGCLTAGPALQRLEAILQREVSLVYVDATGIGWEYEWRGAGLPPHCEPTHTRGYLQFKDIAELRFGCGHGSDEVDLHLRDGTLHRTLPPRVTRPARHDLVELLKDHVSDLKLVECQKPADRR